MNLWAIVKLNNGLREGVRTRNLRYTSASYLAQYGAFLLEIADILGRRQIQMTKRYAHLCVSHKQRLIENYFGEILVETD